VLKKKTGARFVAIKMDVEGNMADKLRASLATKRAASQLPG
jgi:hypothetical protein